VTGRNRSPREHAERGLTLIELVVTVAIVTLAAGFGYEALAARPAQAHGTAAAFAGLIREARALAAVTADPTAGGTGATIGVIRDGDRYVATLYAYRPMLGAARAPVAVADAPLRTATELAIVSGNTTVEPPFALFFSSSGHASAQSAFTVGVTPPPAAEPACPLQSGIVIAFIDGVHDQAHSMSCEMAQLDLDTSVPIAR
jgi:prepilin-type N-terminal cleavage/methylation domain-containing protein